MRDMFGDAIAPCSMIVIIDAIEQVRPPTVEEWIEQRPAAAGFFMG